MTTIAYKNGIVAADSRVTVECEAGGHRVFSSKKLFRKVVEFQGEVQEVILATAGESRELCGMPEGTLGRRGHSR